MITLINDFHKTEIKIANKWGFNAEDAWFQIQYLATQRKNPQALRMLEKIERRLCGISDCKCGTVRGGKL